MFEAKVYIPYNRWGDVKEKFRVPLEEGYTLIPAMGGWKGVEEHVYILQLLRTDPYTPSNLVMDIADTLRKLGEEAVLVYSLDYTASPDEYPFEWRIDYA